MFFMCRVMCLRIVYGDLLNSDLLLIGWLWSVKVGFGGFGMVLFRSLGVYFLVRTVILLFFWI